MLEWLKIIVPVAVVIVVAIGYFIVKAKTGLQGVFPRKRSMVAHLVQVLCERNAYSEECALTVKELYDLTPGLHDQQVLLGGIQLLAEWAILFSHDGDRWYASPAATYKLKEKQKSIRLITFNEARNWITLVIAIAAFIKSFFL